MTAIRACRIVMVHGPADGVLKATLEYVGLHVIHAADDLTGLGAS
jgi:hypothetical protein